MKQYARASAYVVFQCALIIVTLLLCRHFFGWFQDDLSIVSTIAFGAYMEARLARQDAARAPRPMARNRESEKVFEDVMARHPDVMAELRQGHLKQKMEGL